MPNAVDEEYLSRWQASRQVAEQPRTARPRPATG